VGSVWQLSGWIEGGRAVAQIMRGFVYSAHVEVVMDGGRGGYSKVSLPFLTSISSKGIEAKYGKL